MPELDIAVRLGNLFQRIGAVDQRSQLATGQQRTQLRQVLRSLARRGLDRSIPTALREEPGHLRAGDLAHRVEYQIVLVAPPGEVAGGVVDDLGGAYGSDQVDMGGATHRGDGRATAQRQLHRVAADTTRRAVDQHSLAIAIVGGVAEQMQGGHGTDGHGSRLRVGDLGRHLGDHTLPPLFRHTHVLGVRAGRQAGGGAIDPIAHGEAGNVATHRLDLAG